MFGFLDKLFGGDEGLGNGIALNTGKAISGLPGMALNSYVGSQLQGAAQNTYMDKAYPGTSPFERLSGSPGSVGSGGVSDAVRVAEMNTKTQKEVAKIKAKSDERVANINSAAAMGRFRAELPFIADEMRGSIATDAALRQWYSQQASASQVKQLLDESTVKLSKERELRAAHFAEAELTALQAKTVLTIAANLSSSLVNSYTKTAWEVQRKIDEVMKPYGEKAKEFLEILLLPEEPKD